jgi:DNA-binding NtrC family response regulator
MKTIWIVHRDARLRSALARVAAAPDDAVSGSPGDPLFDSAPLADVVLLGLAGDLEAELEFAHRTATRYPEVRWILVAERADAAAARELFDGLDAAILSYPPNARELRALLQATRPGGSADRLPLSRRPMRDSLAERFARWFADLELPELLRALDPRLGDVPLLILGEEGTGRGLLARYVHAFGSAPSAAFAHVPCDATMSAAALRGAIADAVSAAPAARRCSIWLEDVDTLPVASQRQLVRWIEFGPPEGSAGIRAVRWIGSGGDDSAAALESALYPVLREVLCGIPLRLPTLRERPERIARFASDTALVCCRKRREQTRHFGDDALEVLEQYPWPGNQRELEAVVMQTLAAGSMDPIRADDLQYDGVAFAPLDASAVGRRIDPEPDRRRGEPSAPLEAAPVTPIPRSEPPRSSSAPAPSAVERDASASPSASLQHLVSAIAHEMRNPLSTIRTFAELLPERFDDREFRSQFAELVEHDVRRIESVIQRLLELTSLSQPAPGSVDVSALLDELLLECTGLVRERQLLVLKELDTQGASAVGDTGQLRFALESMLRKSMELAPKGGDVYIASSYQPIGLRGMPSVRVLVRFGKRERSRPQSRFPGTTSAEAALDYAIAEAIVRCQGGSFAVDTGENNETVLVVDIPA